MPYLHPGTDVYRTRMRTRKRSRSGAGVAALRFLAATLWATAACAQLSTARLEGIVTDTAGAAVAGASVTAREAQSGSKQTVRTRITGEYLFAGLPAGSYQLTVDMIGFCS